ncbi:MAG: hypothetical protein DRP12_01190 [Candidatus Aenigmatarchaeota archaeon]|nr:MAG: hypothetical protein DRP12_01190 [Candidatus Aenigmarchaeota archaeon]
MKVLEEWERRAILLPIPLYRSIIRRFEILSGTDFTSKVMTLSAYKAVHESLDGEKLNPNAFLKSLLENFLKAKVLSIEIDKDIGGLVKIKDSKEAKSHGNSESPVCWLTLGIIKAVAEKVIGKEVQVIERKCEAVGADHCEFAIILEV